MNWSCLRGSADALSHWHLVNRFTSAQELKHWHRGCPFLILLKGTHVARLSEGNICSAIYATFSTMRCPWEEAVWEPVRQRVRSDNGNADYRNTVGILSSLFLDPYFDGGHSLSRRLIWNNLCSVYACVSGSCHVVLTAG